VRRRRRRRRRGETEAGENRGGSCMSGERVNRVE